jgi:hypothetical protein
MSAGFMARSNLEGKAMKVGRLVLAVAMLAGVATTSIAQGRGGIVQRRGDTLTTQQRQSLRDLRERHQKEITELRSRHREQMERTLPPAALQRLEQRRNQLQREGRMFERQQMARGRAGLMQGRMGMDGRGGQMQGRMGMGGRGALMQGRMGMGMGGRAGLMQGGMGGRAGPPLQMRGRLIGPRGRGGLLPPDSGAVRGRVRDGR